MTPVENEKFTRLLLRAAEDCRHLGYHPRKFMQMVNAEGGEATAKRLLSSSKISDGFVELSSMGHLELTVEALILENGWQYAFDPELIAMATKRLRDVGYKVQVKAYEDQASGQDGDERAGSLALAGNSASLLSLGLSQVLRDYPASTQQAFANHPLAGFIRGELAEIVRKIVSQYAPRLIVKGSAGQGVWARGPWVGIFDPIITTSAQSGYYVCYLFREDMKGVYLSLNQGMTEAKANYKTDAKTALRARAQNFRALLGGEADVFTTPHIDLASASSANDTAFYEAGNILSRYYAASAIPSETALTADLEKMVSLYESLIEGDCATDPSLDDEGDKPLELLIEDGARFRMHKRMERNGKIVKQVKKLKGCRCQVCGADFEHLYGAIGAGYIEAHHLRPLASLKGLKVALDPASDFAVLCSNCHRMVHRSGLINDMDRFKREHYSG